MTSDQFQGLPARNTESRWKRLEKSRQYRLIKTRLRQLLGVEPWIAIDTDEPWIYEGGWTYCPDRLDRNSIVYSIGVGDDISFDLNLIRRTGANVFAFDPTVTLDDLRLCFSLPDEFEFYPWAAAGANGELALYPRVRRGNASNNMFTIVPDDQFAFEPRLVTAKTIDAMATDLGHDRIDLLKIDIEGAEYEVIENLLDSSVRPTQLLVEFHHRHPGFTKHDTINAVRNLKEYGYRVFSCSESVREIGFVFDP